MCRNFNVLFVLTVDMMRTHLRRFATSRVTAHLTDITPSEAAHFQQLATSWWDSSGPQRILHKMNLLRMDFINETMKSHIRVNEGVLNADDKLFIPGWNHKNLIPKEISSEIDSQLEDAIHLKWSDMELKCLDIGCGGGLLSESLARMSNVDFVKGIDMTPDVIEVANQHKQLDPMLESKLQYQLTSLDSVPEDEMYDVVTCMEMLEHVEYPAVVLQKALAHVKPGGYLFLSTINRDFISWFTTIFMGEHILKIVPLGTHTYSKYIMETEIRGFLESMKEFEVINSKGCAYLPTVGWFYSPNANVGNYMMAIKRNDQITCVYK